MPSDIRARRDGALAHIFAQARRKQDRGVLGRLRRALTPIEPGAAWPGQDLATKPLAGWPQLAAWALLGRAGDQELAGSALTLLALAGAEPVTGGLGALGRAFFMEAANGVEIRLGQEAGEVTLAKTRFDTRVTGLVLGDGNRIEADALISTLDFKRSILSLFSWEALPPGMTAAAAGFRMGGGTARLLLALSRESCRPLRTGWARSRAV